MLKPEEDPNDRVNDREKNCESTNTRSNSIKELLEDLRLEQLETA